jgi:glucosamine-6-phosphate deaminase
MAVPLSPAEVACKSRAVFQHESLRHLGPMFSAPADGTGEPEDGARATSRLFDALGMPDYEAIETFRRWGLS